MQLHCVLSAVLRIVGLFFSMHTHTHTDLECQQLFKLLTIHGGLATDDVSHVVHQSLMVPSQNVAARRAYDETVQQHQHTDGHSQCSHRGRLRCCHDFGVRGNSRTGVDVLQGRPTAPAAATSSIRSVRPTCRHKHFMRSVWVDARFAQLPQDRALVHSQTHSSNVHIKSITAVRALVTMCVCR